MTNFPPIVSSFTIDTDKDYGAMSKVTVIFRDTELTAYKALSKIVGSVLPESSVVKAICTYCGAANLQTHLECRKCGAPLVE